MLKALARLFLGLAFLFARPWNRLQQFPLESCTSCFNFRAIPSVVFLTVGNCDIKFLEHVQVKVDLDFAVRGYLYVELQAPSGTISPLTRKRNIDIVSRSRNLTNWKFTTLFNWGENPSGQWRLKIGNLDPKEQHKGKCILCSLNTVIFMDTCLMALTFESLGQILYFDHSNKISSFKAH